MLSSLPPLEEARVPLLGEIRPAVLLSSSHCSVWHTWKQRNDVQFGPNHNICTSPLFTFPYQDQGEMLILDESFLWLVITVIKNAPESGGERWLKCSLTCSIINAELMLYLEERKVLNSLERRPGSTAVVLHLRHIHLHMHCKRVAWWCAVVAWYVCPVHYFIIIILLLCQNLTHCLACFLSPTLIVIHVTCTYNPVFENK